MRTLTTKANYESGAFPFPKDEIDPKQKDSGWCKRWCEAIYAAWVTDRSGIPYSQLEEMRTLRRYGAGNQEVGKYQKVLLDESEPGADAEGFLNVNWEIFSVAPKFKRVVEGMFELQEHNIVATAVDPSSTKLKENAKFMKWFRATYKDQIQMIEAGMGEIQNASEYLPSSAEELNLYTQMGGFKLAKEMEIEEGLNYTFHISDWSETKRKVLNDFMDFNKGAVKDYVDNYTKKVKTRYVDPVNLIIQYSRHWDHRNSEYAGEMVRETISNLRKYTNISEDELRGLAQFYNGRNGNATLSAWTDEELRLDSSGISGWKYDNFYIDVLDVEWFSVNSEYHTKRKNQYGDSLTYREKWGKVYDNEKKQTEVKNIKVVYRAKWIVGSDFVYDFGLQYDVPRPGKKEVELSYSFYQIPGRSMVSLMIQNLDNIQLAWLKLQNAMAMAANSGIAVEYTALQNMKLGGNKMSPLEILEIRRDTGDLIYKSTTHRGQMNIPAGFRPIQELTGGIGPMLEELITIIDMNINLIRSLTGINQVADASTPNPEQSVGGSELAVAATNNALRGIYSAYIRLKEFTARKCTLRLQLLVKHDKKAYEGYVPVVGSVGVKTLSIGADTVDANYFIKIEAKPTEARKQKIRDAAVAAMQTSRDGKAAIEYPDYLLIERALDDGNLKFAEAYLNFKSNQSKKEAERSKIQMMEMDKENAENTARVKGEEQRKSQTQKIQEEIAVERAKGEEERKTEEVKHRNKMEQIAAEKTITEPEVSAVT